MSPCVQVERKTLWCQQALHPDPSSNTEASCLSSGHTEIITQLKLLLLASVTSHVGLVPSVCDTYLHRSTPRPVYFSWLPWLESRVWEATSPGLTSVWAGCPSSSSTSHWTSSCTMLSSRPYFFVCEFALRGLELLQTMEHDFTNTAYHVWCRKGTR